MATKVKDFENENPILDRVLNSETDDFPREIRDLKNLIFGIGQTLSDKLDSISDMLKELKQNELL